MWGIRTVQECGLTFRGGARTPGSTDGYRVVQTGIGDDSSAELETSTFGERGRKNVPEPVEGWVRFAEVEGASKSERCNFSSDRAVPGVVSAYC